jgi:hypothetical protein
MPFQRGIGARLARLHGHRCSASAMRTGSMASSRRPTLDRGRKLRCSRMNQNRSSDGPPPGTTQWTCGWCCRVWPRCGEPWSCRVGRGVRISAGRFERRALA